MKKNWRQAICIMLVFLLAAGCSRVPQLRPKKQQEEQNKTKIAVSIPNSTNENYIVLKEIMTKKAGEEKMEISWLDAQNDPLKQDKDLEEALKEKVKVIIVQPVNPEMLTKKFGDIQKKDAKIIALGSLPPDSTADAFITPDFERAGEMQAQQMLQTIKGNEPYTVLLLRGSRGDPIAERIVKGNLNVLRENKNIGAIWTEEIVNWDPSLAFNVVKKYLENNKIPQAILASSPELSLGALQALEQKGMAGKVKTFGIGTDQKIVEAMEKGYHAAEIDIMPELVAQVSLQAAKDLEKDEPWEYEQLINNGSHTVPARFTPIRAITKENLSLMKERLETIKKQREKKESPEKKPGGNQGGGESTKPAARGWE
ncbi:substrate-binding domain-containing protein [Thermanaerosceptrum fracticalcis]|uniref:Substrate-binding domain-containing protein n=1 Tax=Thermanaerosceptrum fracticalcis TaxID=1712410 RepID=A0A7G6E152_THEFR|nr:substrate-binding domain-containing protein [Thermanaerosceptrum fracticalcis]QNB45806.1 substrate-binding domain-containing protein [Thermanaerosceptrum fracticalcis]